jgi:heme-degrading monooxygenase HmoA
MRLIEMSENITLREQMDQRVGPVVLVNRFTVKPEEAEQLLRAWTVDAEVMKRQLGFISTQMHRGIGDPGEFLNYAVWESVELFKSAFNNPEFRAGLAHYPPSTTASPHLFQKIAVPGNCP